MSKKSNTTALVGAALAAVAAGAYVSYTQGSWPFNAKKATPSPAGSSQPAGAAADVDVALTNEVASYTEHNPNNAADFTDDGATGNAD
ncbi:MULTISPECIES: hypothetical protein [Hymenobacter]|uniref:Uncharacterized protein n=1 Tax=Hymenobacter mucosus TaxID=1411120 RepID=A0A238XZ92_9BACT|nr:MULTISPECIES: hypothetical protein [Hymenobacter]SNR64030.1 hypothetical protein SAMN06269173_104501 [Hymenobacter mucosus]